MKDNNWKALTGDQRKRLKELYKLADQVEPVWIKKELKETLMDTYGRKNLCRPEGSWEDACKVNQEKATEFSELEKNLDSVSERFRKRVLCQFKLETVLDTFYGGYLSKREAKTVGGYSIDLVPGNKLAVIPKTRVTDPLVTLRTKDSAESFLEHNEPLIREYYETLCLS